MIFNQELIYTGYEKKVSKAGKEYVIVNLLDPNGRSFGSICECEIPKDLKQLDLCNVTFKVTTGQYLNLKIIDLAV